MLSLRGDNTGQYVWNSVDQGLVFIVSDGIEDRLRRLRLVEFNTVFFEIRGKIVDVETFAIGKAIRELPRLHKRYGRGRWRKRKGFADVKLPGGTIRKAELHWYEASGIGKKEFKIKRFVD